MASPRLCAAPTQCADKVPAGFPRALSVLLAPLWCSDLRGRPPLPPRTPWLLLLHAGSSPGSSSVSRPLLRSVSAPGGQQGRSRARLACFPFSGVTVPCCLMSRSQKPLVHVCFACFRSLCRSGPCHFVLSGSGGQHVLTDF